MKINKKLCTIKINSFHIIDAIYQPTNLWAKEKYNEKR